MINVVALTGRLTRDPECKVTPNGISVCQFTLAVDRNYANAGGKREADFISCVVWRKQAEAFCQFNRKGSLIGLEGRIETRNYEDKDGKRVYVTEVLVDSWSFLESKKQREAQNDQQSNQNYNQGNQPQVNYSSSQASPQPANNANQTPMQNALDPFGGDAQINVTNDDLPF